MDAKDQGPRTYSIWSLLAVFVVLLAVGIYYVVAHGTVERTSTHALPTQTATTAPPAASTASTVAPKMLDGSAAPDNVFKIVSSPGDTSYLFRLPDGFTDDPTHSVVAHTDAVPSRDGKAITVTMYCAVSTGSVPAVIRVTEDPYEVNVQAVAIGRSAARACAADDVIETITIPLGQPLGTRSILLAEQGTPVELSGIN